ncbi:hypothetical protein Tco_0544023 [Tanacetum coccineum]
MRSEHNLREKKKFEVKCARQADMLKEKDSKIADLKARPSLKEAEVVEAIRLRGQFATVEATEAAQVNELNGLKDQNSILEEEKHALEEKVATIESATATKDIEFSSLTTNTAQLTHDLSILQASFDELSIKAASLESQKDNLANQAFSLEVTCFGLRDQVFGYELIKEQCEALQDEQVKVLSDRVVGLDSELILSRGVKLVVMKCLQLAKYLAVLGEAISHAINKGMQYGLVVGINHWKAGRGLVDVATYNPSTEANYVSAVNALHAMDFHLLAQLESQKDASIADIMGLLHLEGPAVETLKASQLQPSPEQLMLSIHRDVASCHLSLSEAMIPLIEPLFSENLVSEASTSGVPTTAAITIALSTTFVQTSFIPPISVSDYETFQVRGKDSPLRSLSLYAPLPSASVTSYGPSHLGPSFPPSSAWLASLLRYTRSTGLKLVWRALGL